MKPYIKQRRFCLPSSAGSRSVPSSAEAALPLGHLDRLSVFETLRAYKGRIFCCEEHLKRLSESCAAIGRVLPLSAKKLTAWIYEALRESGHADASLRLSLHWLNPHEGELVLFVRHFSSHPEAWYKKGVAIRSTVGRRVSARAQDPQIKASQYVGGVLAMLDNGELPAYELLFFGPEGTVAEGSVSNIFIVKEKCLLTPSAASGILRGVTRAFVLVLARKRGLRVVETTLTRHDLYTAQECFLTNTSSEILSVVNVDGRRIGDGAPGPTTRLLGEDFRKNR